MASTGSVQVLHIVLSPSVLLACSKQMRAAWAQSKTIFWKEAGMKLLRLQRYILFICSLTGGVALEKIYNLFLTGLILPLEKHKSLCFLKSLLMGKNAQTCVKYAYTHRGQLLMEGAAGLSLRKCVGKASPCKLPPHINILALVRVNLL